MTNLTSMTGFLPACSPFDFAQSLLFLADFGPLRDDMLVANGAMTRALQLDGQAIVVQVQATQATKQVGLDYTFWASEQLTAAQIATIEQRVSFFLSLQDDLRPLYTLAEDDPFFRPIVQQLHGYHQVKFPSGFENAVWAVLSQRNTLPAARTMRSALVSQYGSTLDVHGHTWRAFPEPECVADAALGDVTAVVRHSQKGPAIAAVAAAFNQIDERWLQTVDYDQALRWLLDIHGIGPWGASFVMLRGLGRMERLVSGEGKLLTAIGKQYQRGGPVSEREAATLAARYGAYQGYWAHYLRVVS